MRTAKAPSLGPGAQSTNPRLQGPWLPTAAPGPVPPVTGLQPYPLPQCPGSPWSSEAARTPPPDVPVAEVVPALQLVNVSWGNVTGRVNPLGPQSHRISGRICRSGEAGPSSGAPTTRDWVWEHHHTVASERNGPVGAQLQPEGRKQGFTTLRLAGPCRYPVVDVSRVAQCVERLVSSDQGRRPHGCLRSLPHCSPEAPNVGRRHLRRSHRYKVAPLEDPGNRLVEGALRRPPRRREITGAIAR